MAGVIGEVGVAAIYVDDIGEVAVAVVVLEGHRSIRGDVRVGYGGDVTGGPADAPGAAGRIGDRGQLIAAVVGERGGVTVEVLLAEQLSGRGEGVGGPVAYHHGVGPATVVHQRGDHPG